MKTQYKLSVGGSNTCYHFASEDLAKNALRKVSRKLAIRPGVQVIVDEPFEFAFLLGWEETRVTWRITEYKVIDSEEEFTYDL